MTKHPCRPDGRTSPAVWFCLKCEAWHSLRRKPVEFNPKAKRGDLFTRRVRVR